LAIIEEMKTKNDGLEEDIVKEKLEFENLKQ
jgi:hypothetical protein